VDRDRLLENGRARTRIPAGERRGEVLGGWAQLGSDAGKAEPELRAEVSLILKLMCCKRTIWLLLSVQYRITMKSTWRLGKLTTFPFPPASRTKRGIDLKILLAGLNKVIVVSAS